MEIFTQEKLSSLFQWNTDGEIIQNEGNDVEYKLSFNLKKSELLRVMSGLANNNGGFIIFGVDDKTKKLIGLDDKAIEHFSNVDSEEYRGFFLTRCNPNIRYERYIHNIDKKSFGIIYVYKENNKPCIINTNDDGLKPGDIYYRYNDSIQKIRYAELNAIIEEKRIKEQEKWMNFLEKIAKVGIDNLILIDCKNGNLITNASEKSIKVDPELLKDFKLVEEGHFVDNNGNPTLKLVGKVVGDNIEFTTEGTTSMFDSSNYFKYSLGDIKRRIMGAHVKTRDNIDTNDFAWHWNKVLFYVENNRLKENSLYAHAKTDDADNIVRYDYSTRLFDDFSKFINEHTKDELLNLKKIVEVTNE